MMNDLVVTQLFHLLIGLGQLHFDSNVIENTFLVNSLRRCPDLSIHTDSKIEMSTTLSSSKTVIAEFSLSVGENLVRESVLENENFDSNSIVLISFQNLTYFNESLTTVIERSKIIPKWYFLVYPDIFTNESSVNNKFNDLVTPHLKNTLFTSNIYVLFVVQKSNDTALQFVIKEGYTVSQNYLFRNIEIEQGKTLDWYNLLNKINRRKDTMEAELRATSVNDSNYGNETKYFEPTLNDTEIKFESGYAVLMLWFIRDLFNFKIKALMGNWTSISFGDNGTSWLTGNGAAVTSGEADISISQQSLNLDYMRHDLFYLHPTNYAGLRLYFIQPEMSQYRDIFLIPFAGDLWIVVVIVLILIIFTVKMFGFILSRYAEEDEENNELVESVVVWSVAIMTQQGFHVQPSSLSIRIVFLLGYVTGLVCFIAYSAQIVSTLSVKTVPIHRAEDILNGHFHLYANPNNTAMAVIDHILEETKLSNESVYMEERDAINRIMKKKSIMQALIAEPDIFYTEARIVNCTNKEICDLFSSLQLHKSPVRGGMFVRRNSPYTEWFNYGIILMLERGLNHRFVNNYIRKSWVICLDEKNAFVQPVKVSDILSAFKILLLGYTSSILMLICEYFVNFRRQMKEPKDGHFNFLM